MSRDVHQPRAPLATLLLLVGGMAASLAGCPATAPTPKPTPRPHLQPIALDEGLLCAGPDVDPRCAPDDTHEAVELRHHIAGCEAGLRGPVSFHYDGVHLATLFPGEAKTFRLPRGDATIAIRHEAADGAQGAQSGDEIVNLGLYGKGPVKVEVGCAPGRFVAAGLKPLVVRGPKSAACPPVRVRAGGLEFAVPPRQARTLFLPTGEHLVRFLGANATPLSVLVRETGATVQAPDCGAEGRRAHPDVSSRRPAGDDGARGAP